MPSASDHPLRDGVAVVTGAAAGIGEAIARHAASLGMRVVVTDVAEEHPELEGPLATHRRA